MMQSRTARFVILGLLFFSIIFAGFQTTAMFRSKTTLNASAATATPLTPTSCCDGILVQNNVGGQPVWQIASGSGFMYFKIPSSFTFTQNSSVYVQVDYYDDDGAGGGIGLQYDATGSNYQQSVLHARTSRVGTNQFVSAYFELPNAHLAGGENGGNDFRVSWNGGSTSPSIKGAFIQTTPFNDPTFQTQLSRPWLSPYTGSTRNDVDPSTLKGKVMAGYQGWFSTPNDLNDQGWVHWFGHGGVGPAYFNTDMWPDLSQYPADTYVRAANINTQSGKPAYLFSSTSPEVVNLHFQWMRENNIDGAFLQRFLDPNNTAAGGHPEFVLNNVRAAANQQGRIWAIEYDVSGLSNANVYNTVTNDWKWLVDKFGILKDPRYAHQGGKPVVVIWGLPFTDRGFNTTVSDQVVDFFKNDPTYGNTYVLGGIPNVWQSQTSWTEHFQRYNGLLVWQSQNYQTDQTTFNSWGIDYYPHVWPGFSWANLSRLPASSPPYDPRNGGTFYWNKVSSAIAAGADRMFVGMFDEYDEGTAIMPMSDDPPPPYPQWGRFITNDGRSSHWWLNLTDYARQMMLKQIPLTTSMPTAYPTPTPGTGGATSTPTTKPASTSTPTAAAPTATPVQGTTVYAINAGGAATGNFIADKFFDSGTAYSDTSAAINTSGATNPAPQAVYQTVRWNTNFNYNITSLTAGSSYKVRLHWAELSFQASGMRVFNVGVNGSAVLSNFDVFAQAGYKKALIKEFTTTASSSGQIQIAFTNGGHDNPFISGIEVVSLSGSAPTATPTAKPASTATATSTATTKPTATPTTAPGATATPTATTKPTSTATSTATPTSGLTLVTAINAGGSASAPYGADADFNSGSQFSDTSAAINTSGVSNPAPQSVYQTCRWNSSFAYTIPGLTAGATYTVRLDWAELTWQSSGSRVFNVAINGTTTLSNFDVFAQAGYKKALVKTFTATANSSGQIVISFTNGGHDNPFISGLAIYK